eukprot:4465617-Alexandrium_andersonii.AAC.1
MCIATANILVRRARTERSSGASRWRARTSHSHRALALCARTGRSHRAIQSGVVVAARGRARG